jgi:hypothetical protein
LGGLIRSTSFQNLRRRPAVRRIVSSHFCRHLIDINDILVRRTILWSIRNVLQRRCLMRALHHFIAIAIAALALFVIGAKSVLPASQAEAYAVRVPTLNVLQMQADYAKTLPELKMHDMTFALD